jgi:hypothetical protein
MYGYLPGELIGQPAGSPVPDGLRAAHVSQRAGYAGHPTACPAIRITKTSEPVCVQGAVSECRRHRSPLPRCLSRSVIDSVGPASAEYAPNADSERRGRGNRALGVHTDHPSLWG